MTLQERLEAMRQADERKKKNSEEARVVGVCEMLQSMAQTAQDVLGLIAACESFGSDYASVMVFVNEPVEAFILDSEDGSSVFDIVCRQTPGASVEGLALTADGKVCVTKDNGTSLNKDMPIEEIAKACLPVEADVKAFSEALTEYNGKLTGMVDNIVAQLNAENPDTEEATHPVEAADGTKSAAEPVAEPKQMTSGAAVENLVEKVDTSEPASEQEPVTLPLPEPLAGDYEDEPGDGDNSDSEEDKLLAQLPGNDDDDADATYAPPIGEESHMDEFGMPVETEQERGIIPEEFSKPVQDALAIMGEEPVQEEHSLDKALDRHRNQAMEVRMLGDTPVYDVQEDGNDYLIDLDSGLVSGRLQSAMPSVTMMKPGEGKPYAFFYIEGDDIVGRMEGRKTRIRLHKGSRVNYTVIETNQTDIVSVQDVVDEFRNNMC